MSGDNLSKAIDRVEFDTPGILKPIGLGLTVVGLAGFIGGLFVDADTAWRAYLSNFAFWLGISLSGVVWSAVMRLTNARWGRSLMRLWEGTGYFLPIAVVLYLGLIAGGMTSHLYEWVHHPIHHKEAWLSPGFLFGRNAVYMLILVTVCMVYMYQSLRGDVRTLKAANKGPDWFQRLFGNASGSDEEWESAQAKLKKLAVAVPLVYALMVSFISFDLLMSIEPYWYSTMFGGWIFMGNMLMGLAFIALAASMVRKRSDLYGLIGKNQLWDVGKLLFAFTMIWVYLTWSQYLPIWYANIHEEAGFVIKRTGGAYRPWALAVVAMVWVIPWFILLPKPSKQNPIVLGSASVIVLAGMWMERWTIIAPAQFPEAPVPEAMVVYPGWIEFATLAFFAGLFLLAYRFFLTNSPILAVGDPVFEHVAEHGSHGHH